MKAFDITRKRLAFVGIESYQLAQKYPFNIRNVAFISTIFMEFISSCLYIFLEADNLEEYVNSSFIVSSLVTCISLFGQFIWNTLELYTFFDDIEKIIAVSKYQTLKFL